MEKKLTKYAKCGHRCLHLWIVVYYLLYSYLKVKDEYRNMSILTIFLQLKNNEEYEAVIAQWNINKLLPQNLWNT